MITVQQQDASSVVELDDLLQLFTERLLAGENIEFPYLTFRTRTDHVLNVSQRLRKCQRDRVACYDSCARPISHHVIRSRKPIGCVIGLAPLPIHVCSCQWEHILDYVAKYLLEAHVHIRRIWTLVSNKIKLGGNSMIFEQYIRRDGDMLIYRDYCDKADLNPDCFACFNCNANNMPPIANNNIDLVTTIKLQMCVWASAFEVHDYVKYAAVFENKMSSITICKHCNKYVYIIETAWLWYCKLRAVFAQHTSRDIIAHITLPSGLMYDYIKAIYHSLFSLSRSVGADIS